jgi:hypothetical protein
MADTPHRAKKSKKNRKFGRNKKDSDRQKSRTVKNKTKRINYERKKAGLPPVDEHVAQHLADTSKIKN